jgi:hypothetical protein
MAKGDQINFKPHFRDEGPTLPCEGQVGDLFVFSPLNDGERDGSPQGLASLWFCTRGMDEEGRPATWARVQFDGIATCEVRLPTPPQNRPQLNEG